MCFRLLWDKHYKQHKHKQKDKMENLIRLGHYREKSTLNSDTAKIIRIRACDKNNQNLWITSDGTKISEYDLINNYVFMDTHYKDISQSPIRKPIIGDISNMSQEIADNSIENIQQNTVSKIDDLPINTPVTNLSLNQPTQPATKIKEEKLENIILRRCSYDYIDKQNSEEYSIDYKTKRKTITLSFDLQLGYDIDKLKTLITSLNLNKNFIINEITKDILKNDFSFLLIKELSEVFMEKTNTDNVTSSANVQLHQKYDANEVKNVETNNENIDIPTDIVIDESINNSNTVDSMIDTTISEPIENDNLSAKDILTDRDKKVLQTLKDMENKMKQYE